MQWLIEVGLSNALAATGLAVAAWIVGGRSRRPAVAHALWLLVLLKLLTPPIFEFRVPVSIVPTAVEEPSSFRRTSQVVATTLQRKARIGAAVPAPAAIRDPDRSLNSRTERAWSDNSTDARVSARRRSATSTAETTGQTIPAFSPPRSEAGGRPPMTLPNHAAASFSWSQLAVIAWLIGLAIWLALQAVLLLRLHAVVCASAEAPLELTKTAEGIAQGIGLRKCPGVRIVAGSGSPMLYGLGRRALILIPAALLHRLAPEAQRAVLAHELAHHRRGDQWVRLLELAVTGLYWWLPTVWWARQRLELAEEQCCDVHAVEMCGGKRRVYAEALLDIIDLISEPSPMRPAMSSSIGQRPLLQKRLVDLMRHSCAARMAPATRRLVVIAGAVCLSCHPAIFVTARSTARAASATSSLDVLRRGFHEPVSSKSSPGQERSEPQLFAAIDQPPPDLSLSNQSPPELSPTTGEPENSEWATAISPNGRYHITVRLGYECELREVTTNEVHRLRGQRITCAVFTRDSTRFVSGDLEGRVQLWDAASAEVLHTLAEHEAAIYALSLSPLHDEVVAAGANGVVELLNLTSPGDRQLVARLDAPVRCARFSPDGLRLAIVTDTWKTTSPATIAVYDVVSRRPLFKWDTPVPVGALGFPSSDRLVSLEWSGRARAWTLPALYVVELPPLSKELVSAASFSADTRVLEDLGDQR